MMKLVAMWSLNSPSAMACALRYTLASLRVTRSMLMSVPPSSGNSTEVSTTMRPVGILLVETTAMVRPDSALSRLTGSVATRRSKPR